MITMLQQPPNSWTLRLKNLINQAGMKDYLILLLITGQLLVLSFWIKFNRNNPDLNLSKGKNKFTLFLFGLLLCEFVQVFFILSKNTLLKNNYHMLVLGESLTKVSFIFTLSIYFYMFFIKIERKQNRITKANKLTETCLILFIVGYIFYMLARIIFYQIISLIAFTLSF